MTDYEKLLTYSLGILSKKRYTEKQILDKLYKKVKSFSLDEQVIDRVLERLIELRYLNDYEFSLDYISDRCRLRPRGERLIRLELYQKGIKKAIIDKAFENSVIDEIEMAKFLLEKQVRKNSGMDRSKLKQKIYTYLYSKGFSKDCIYNTFDSW